MQRYYFPNETHYFQNFVRENIRFIGRYEIIAEQLMISNNETGFIDMLVLDLDDKRLTILELKNRLATDKDTWQPIRYYDFMRRGEDDLKVILRNSQSKLSIDVNEINLDPKLVVIAPEFNEQFLRTLSYFENIDSKLVELQVFINDKSLEFNKKTYYPSSIYHREDLVEIKKPTEVGWNFEEYKKLVNGLKIDLAKKVANQVQRVFSTNGHKFDLFFTKTKATIMKDNKVWGHLYVSQKPLDHKLTIDFKIDRPFNKIDFVYEASIESVQQQKSSVKVQLNSVLSESIIKKYFH